LKALADTATSSRHILTFINIPADETNNLPIDDTTNDSPTDDTTNPLADDIIDDNDGFFFLVQMASSLLIIVNSNCID
jgi:hypothetical protein